MLIVSGVCIISLAVHGSMMTISSVLTLEMDVFVCVFKNINLKTWEYRKTNRKTLIAQALHILLLSSFMYC